MSDPTQDGTFMTRAERKAAGKALRHQAPRRSHANWQPADDRPDPLTLLQEQDEGRLRHLLPIKYGRMLASPFAFFRGSAVVMAADLAHSPVSGLEAILCGDAHLSNFGLFATPERDLVFDINDFDETFPGPWEWDLKRLAASAVVAGRENGFSDSTNRDLARTVAGTYRDAMRKFARDHTLDVWYFHVDAADVQDVFATHSSKKAIKKTQKVIAKARTRTQEQTLDKLTEIGADGRRRILSNPPLLVPLRAENLHHFSNDDAFDRNWAESSIRDAWTQYLTSLPDERRFLLERFHWRDVALRVGGVGSVGTRCFIALLEGGAENDAIVLQMKEAGPSALERFLTDNRYEKHAERVVIGQRLMQAASDIFLGWHKGTLSGFEFYWRQLKDMKGSFDVAALDESGLETYLRVCSVCLARAHARTGDPSSIAGYMGKGSRFSKSIAGFAMVYADQTEKDYAALTTAVKNGRIAAETGI